MRIPNSLLTFSFITVASLSSLAAEKIEGAFGQTLGAKFDPTTALKKTTNQNGVHLYEFTPKNPLRSFLRYFVLITPNTHKIYRITTNAKFDNSEICKKEQSVIMELLARKYGEEMKSEPFNLNNKRIILDGNRAVSTILFGLDQAIELTYTDLDLLELAEKERISNEAAKSDASGL
jgi:hypothetical protein